MPSRSRVEALPSPMIDWLKNRLAQAGFADYEVVTQELNQKLQETGWEQEKISRSSLNRWAQNWEEEIKDLKLAHDYAVFVSQNLPDDQGQLGLTVSRLLQTESLSLIRNLRQNPEFQELPIDEQSKVLATLSNSHSRSVEADTKARRLVQELREKIEAKFAEIEAKPKAAIDPETLKRIREEVYGIWN